MGAALANPISNPPDPRGLQFRMTISLGNIIQLVVLVGMGIIGWTNIQDRQAQYEREAIDQQKEIAQLFERMENTAQLNARQAAILDEVEKRVARVEQKQDEGR